MPTGRGRRVARRPGRGFGREYRDVPRRSRAEHPTTQVGEPRPPRSRLRRRLQRGHPGVCAGLPPPGSAQGVAATRRRAFRTGQGFGQRRWQRHADRRCQPAPGPRVLGCRLPPVTATFRVACPPCARGSCVSPGLAHLCGAGSGRGHVRSSGPCLESLGQRARHSAVILRFQSDSRTPETTRSAQEYEE